MQKVESRKLVHLHLSNPQGGPIKCNEQRANPYSNKCPLVDASIGMLVPLTILWIGVFRLVLSLFIGLEITTVFDNCAMFF